MTIPVEWTGRFAPSPTGRLHLGNLRTALIAWLFARHRGGRFLLRFEDLDTASIRTEHYGTQADDLRALGLVWDGEPVLQSGRVELYEAAIEQLIAADLVYRCYCSRKDIRDATQAPNGLYRSRLYPGTCRDLAEAEHRRREAAGRAPALRMRAAGRSLGFDDLVCGRFESDLDDFVVRRGDGTPAYNLAATVDDLEQGVDVVVRADDLLDSTPRQIALIEALDERPLRYAHVPLMLHDGDRLAKRHGAVTLEDRVSLGQSPAQVRSVLAASLGLCEVGEILDADELATRFDPSTLPREPWDLSNDDLIDANLGL